MHWSRWKFSHMHCLGRNVIRRKKVHFCSMAQNSNKGENFSLLHLGVFDNAYECKFEWLLYHYFRACLLVLGYHPKAKARGNVFPGNIYGARMFHQRLPILPHGKHCFQKQNMFLRCSRNIFYFWKQCFPYGKTGKHWEWCALQILETCFGLFCQILSSCFRS